MPIASNDKKRTVIAAVRCSVAYQKITLTLLLITSLTLSACQHIQLVDSPLPIATDTIDISPPPHSPATSPTPAHNQTPFLLLEDWF